jgi:putative phage-type endonuclease
MIKQGTPEWHEQRKATITGTRCQKTARECAYTSGDQWEALGREMFRADNMMGQDPFPQNAIYAMKHGTDSEPVALKCLQDMGYQIVPTSFVRHKDYDWLGMSPDGIIKKGRSGKISGVEIKCPISKPAKDVKKDKRNYWHQMQLGMECMDIDEMLFFQWYKDENHSEWVERDPTWAQTYIPKAKAFMEWYEEKKIDPECIARWSEDKEEPGVNYKSVEEDDETMELSKIVEEIKKLDAIKKPLEIKKKEVASKLVEKYKGAFSTSSVKCHISQAKGRVNYTKMVRELDIPYETVEGYREEAGSRIYTKLVEE